MPETIEIPSTPFGITHAANGDVACSRGLRAYPLLDSRNQRVATVYGLLLRGWAGAGLHVTADAVRTDFPVADVDIFEGQVLPGLHGMFQAVTDAPLPHRLYLDTGGCIPAVYCTRSRRIASSAYMLFDREEYQQRFLADRYERLVVHEGHGWIAGTLTAHADVWRLLPNHYLDLETLTTHRYWPDGADFPLDMPLETAAQTVAAALRGYIEACVREHDTAIMMTAGFDSRILIAASRNVADRISFITLGKAGDGLDQDMATVIARELHLTHRLQPQVPANAAQQQLWEQYVGHVVRERNRQDFPTLGALSHDVILTGILGETGRSHLYKQDVDRVNDQPVTASAIVARLTLPPDPETLRTVEEWLDPIRMLPPSAILDLAYDELRGGSWAMAQSPIQKAMKWSLMPFAQRQVLAAFMSVPPATKGKSALFQRIGEILWPEAMAFPINRYGDWRDHLGKLAKLTKRESIVRYFRNRMAGAGKR